MTKRPAHDGDDVGAQAEYDGGPELRELLTRAAASPTVHGVNAGNDVDDGAAWVDRLRSGSRMRDVTDHNADDDVNVDSAPDSGLDAGYAELAKVYNGDDEARDERLAARERLANDEHDASDADSAPDGRT